MGKFDKLKKFMNILESVDSAEKAIALSGPERKQYLDALDAVYGDKAKRMKDMGFGDKTWFHGTTVPIDEFQNTAKGLSTNAQSAKKGFFFAQDPSTASDYANLANEKGIVREGDKVTTKWLSAKEYQESVSPDVIKDLKYDLYEKQSLLKKYSDMLENTEQTILNRKTKKIPEGITPQEHADDIKWLEEKANNFKDKINGLNNFILENDKKINFLQRESESGGQNVLPVRLKGNKENIHVKNYGGESYRDTTYADEMAKAQASGKTGVLFKNTYDPADQSNRVRQNIAAVFEPNQIRSEFAAFDPRFKNSAKLMAGVSPAANQMFADNQQSPLDYLKKGFDYYQDKVAKPIGDKMKSMLTPDVSVSGQSFKTSSPATDFLIDTVSDPINYVPGSPGAAMTALQVMSGLAKRPGDK